MEEKKNYMYGAEISLGMSTEEGGEVWESIVASMIGDTMIKISQYCLEKYGKIIGYDIEYMKGEVSVRVMSGSKEIVEDISDSLEDIIGIQTHYRKFEIYTPHP